MRDLSTDKEGVMHELKSLLHEYGYNLHDTRIENIFLGYALRYTDNDHTYGMELVELINILKMSGSIDVVAPASKMTICSDRLKSALLKHLEYLFTWYVQNDEGVDIEPNDALKLFRRAANVDDRYYKPKLPARRLGFQLSYVYGLLKSYGVFGEKPTRKERCFLYDYLVIMGEVERFGMYVYVGDVAKEKSDMIKNWMNAYNNMKNTARG